MRATAMIKKPMNNVLCSKTFSARGNLMVHVQGHLSKKPSKDSVFSKSGGHLTEKKCDAT